MLPAHHVKRASLVAAVAAVPVALAYRFGLLYRYGRVTQGATRPSTSRRRWGWRWRTSVRPGESRPPTPHGEPR